MQQQDIQVIRRISTLIKVDLKKTSESYRWPQLSCSLACYCCLLDEKGSSFIVLLHSIFLHC